MCRKRSCHLHSIRRKKTQATEKLGFLVQDFGARGFAYSRVPLGFTNSIRVLAAIAAPSPTFCANALQCCVEVDQRGCGVQ